MGTVTLGSYTYSAEELALAINAGLAHNQVTHDEAEAAKAAGPESLALKAVALKVINFLGCSCCGHPVAICDC